MNVSSWELKACCASAYASDAARWLLGDCLHPGGPALTARLIAALDVGRGALVADVACGPGATCLQLARATGCRVVGIDVAEESLERGRAAARRAGLGERVRFVRGDAEALPLEDGDLDGAVCECALCTFPDKPAAAGELARVLRPGARLALSDVTAEADRLPPELRTRDAWIACVADALALDELAALLESAGLVVERKERHDGALAELIERVDGRLRLARVLRERLPDGLREGVVRALDLVGAARVALDDGALGYGVVVARRS
jgi:ubiquinone/menaquinone biosynthesis C-methylase UbiE